MALQTEDRTILEKDGNCSRLFPHHARSSMKVGQEAFSRTRVFASRERTCRLPSAPVAHALLDVPADSGHLIASHRCKDAITDKRRARQER